MDQIKIGKFIASKRKEKGLTQQELADKLQVTDRAIGNWENGRRMPDLVFLKDLATILEVSINELITGEEIKKDELKEKSDENIIRTINYSQKKIKHTKLLSKLIISGIILLVLVFLTLLFIDMNRMKNNKPVLFSTWGFKYFPTIDYLNDLKIESVIKDYLTKEDEVNKHHEDEKSFAAIKVYEIEDKKDKVIVYAWVLMEKYYLENTEIKQDSGSSIPYKFELVKKDKDYTFKNYEIPRDGEYYATDMKSLFPKSVLKEMDYSYYDGTMEKLEFEIQEQVHLYYHK